MGYSAHRLWPFFGKQVMANGIVSRVKTATFLLAVFALFAAPSLSQAQDARGPSKVIVSKVVSKEIADKVEALGTLRANETIELTTTVSDRIIELNFDDGERVTAGRVLVRLDNNEELADLKAAEAVLAEREAAYERTKQLATRDFASKANLDQGLANLLSARAAVETVKAQLADRVLKAPFDGVVGLRTISVGALVEPGDVITTLDDISVVKLDFNVPSTYLATLETGLKIKARTSAYGGEVFDGEIRSLSNQIDPVTRAITARAVIDNADLRLRPGLLMTVTLFKNPRQALLLREEALMPNGSRNFVLVVGDNNIPEKREVRLGTRTEGWVEVLEGLSVDERVITHGTIKARPGQPVEIITEEEGEQTIGDMIKNSQGS